MKTAAITALVLASTAPVARAGVEDCSSIGNNKKRFACEAWGMFGFATNQGEWEVCSDMSYYDPCKSNCLTSNNIVDCTNKGYLRGVNFNTENSVSVVDSSFLEQAMTRFKDAGIQYITINNQKDLFLDSCFAECDGDFTCEFGGESSCEGDCRVSGVCGAATDAPTAATEAPTVATEAPTAGAEATPAPTAGAEATPAPTAGAVATPAPTAGAEATPAPTAGAEATPAPTAGAEATPAPTAGAVETDAPTASTKAPTASTKAPTAGTKAPTASTKAPTASTKAPTAGTKAPTAGTKAPTASAPETAAPTVDVGDRQENNSTNTTVAPTSAPTDSPGAAAAHAATMSLAVLFAIAFRQ